MRARCPRYCDVQRRKDPWSWRSPDRENVVSRRPGHRHGFSLGTANALGDGLKSALLRSATVDSFSTTRASSEHRAEQQIRRNQAIGSTKHRPPPMRKLRKDLRKTTQFAHLRPRRSKVGAKIGRTLEDAAPGLGGRARRPRGPRTTSRLFAASRSPSRRRWWPLTRRKSSRLR